MPRSMSQVHQSIEGSSSPDPLTNSSESGNTLHSILRPKRRLSSPRKTPLSTRNANSQMPASSPAHSYLAPNSPSKAITEQTLSPWKIRVTVEAEPEDGDDRAQISTRTYHVPLKPCSSPTETNAVRGRGKQAQSSPARKKRSGTPVRGARNRRKSVTDLNITVLGDDEDEDEWSPNKKSSAKTHGRSRSASPRKTQTKSRESTPVVENVDVHDPGSSLPPNEPDLSSVREIDLDRVSVRARSYSTRKKETASPDPQTSTKPRPQGRMKATRDFSNTGAISYPTPSPTPSAPGEEADVDGESMEGDVGYDTIIESEGFTMIDLDSIPSARQFLSSPDEPSQSDAAVRKSHDRARQSIGEVEAIPQRKQATPLSARLRTAFEDTELSSNVASSPPSDNNFLQVQSHRPTNLRKVTPDVYSSPKLPSPPRQSKKDVSPGADTLPPRRVVKAGKALCGALADPEMVDENLQQTPSSTKDGFLHGFSSGTKRELRAGLRFGEELAKKSSTDVPATNVESRTSQTNTTQGTQVWRGETVVQHSPVVTDLASQTKDRHNVPSSVAKLSKSPLSNTQLKCPELADYTTETRQQTPQSKSQESNPQLQTSRERRLEHEWQLEREAVSQQIDRATPSKVIVIDSSDDEADVCQDNVRSQDQADEQLPVPVSEDHEEGRRGGRETWAQGHGPSRPDRAGSQKREQLDETQPVSTQRIPEANREDSEVDIVEDEDLVADETDIWLLEAKEGSSSPREEHQQALSKPRRSLIPSPWKRGDDVAEASTMLSNGDLSGMLWQQPVENRFGAGELARQTQRISKGKFDLDRMLSSPVKLATVGRRNLQLRRADEQLSSDPGSTSESAESILAEDLEESVSHSSMASSPPQPRTIPVNFNDSTIANEDVTPPPLYRSSQTSSDEPRPPTPRSALKGGRVSAGLEDPETSPMKRVIFNERSRYLREDGDESTMSANLDSPPALPAQPYHASLPEEEISEEVVAEKTPKATEKNSSWASWLWRGKVDSSSSGASSQPTSDATPTIQESSKVEEELKAEEEEEEAEWVSTKTTLSSGVRVHETSTKPLKARVSKPPSYLLPPSYPSLGRTQYGRSHAAPPLATSGHFTNAHFRVLHIIHGKSLRPRFHAPKTVRPEIQALRGMKLTVDETEAGMDVFEWTVGVEECLVLERFMQEIEWGWVQHWYQGKAVEALKAKVAKGEAEAEAAEGEDLWTAEMRKVGWVWKPEEIAKHLGMVVIGEVVRREEMEMERVANQAMKREA
ncbi:uncharacterized protein HMPREF1541_08168 [Cyphellophora europaea CBS 101466]|uniref:Uncharacterized protein n=1 Tax=Cyphellophora europaea (strain CBS 101466) TaxID=1220924 RepID=W2RN94_CYPE1|nr:uncharacterized protein HMPREF1541_08168 [Cyphellophora europaea CBS 101466]ETN37178.1 hypothetical protein HMPREF1541_08168 [Cyphellophora europaea CBS 101466]